jgi:hypothetical protein
MAREAVHMAREGAVYPSVDPTVLAVGPNAEGEPALTVADFSGVTLVGMPAKVGTFVMFPDDEVEVDDDAPAPTAAEVRRMVEDDVDDDGDLIDAVYGADEAPQMRALIAAVIEAPPAEAFGRPDIPPGFDGYRIEGRRIYGNLYPVGACHLNWRDQCVMAPESASGYTLFRRYSVTTDRGDIPVGRLTTGLGRLGNGCACCDPSVIDDHACPNTKGLIAAMSHHDLMPTLADVNVGEHEGAIWVAGILRPNLPDGADAVLARRVWSGDWRPSGEGDELVEVLALHHGEPGFTTRVQHARGRGVLIAATGPAASAPVEEPVDVPALVARTVHTLAAVQTMNTAVADAAQARARAELTRLERTA